MKVELEKLTLGKSGLTDSIFVGIPEKEGVWRHKKDITNDFLACVIARFDGYKEVLSSSDGRKYEIVVKEIRPKKKKSTIKK